MSDEERLLFEAEQRCLRDVISTSPPNDGESRSDVITARRHKTCGNCQVASVLNTGSVCKTKHTLIYRTGQKLRSKLLFIMVTKQAYALICKFIRRMTATENKKKIITDFILQDFYYRAMHLSAKCGIEIACRLSVRLSVRLTVTLVLGGL